MSKNKVLPTVKPVSDTANKNLTSPIVETDPITTCTSKECGDREVRNSICEKSTCCEVSDSWIWVESQSLCYQMQKDAKQEYDELRKKEYDFYLDEQRQEGVKQESERAKQKQECESAATANYLKCMDNCNETFPQGDTYGYSCTGSCKNWYETSKITCL